MKVKSCSVTGFVALLGCSAPNEPAYPDLDTPLEPAALVEVKPAPPTPPVALKLQSGTIHRADLTRVVDAGLGRFLQHVEVDAALEAGKFRGFRIVSLTPPEFWAGVDLRPGDVVTQVNGMSIERPPQAYEAFTSLKTAKQLVVSYTRQGQSRQLIYPIRPAVTLALPTKGTAQSKPEGS